MHLSRSARQLKAALLLSSSSFAIFCFVGHGSVFAGDDEGRLESGSAAIYAQHCASCHGRDGRAKTAKGKRLGATDFTGDWNTDDARGIRIITNGRDEMPAFKNKLTPEQIRSVWAYARSFKK